MRAAHVIPPFAAARHPPGRRSRSSLHLPPPTTAHRRRCRLPPRPRLRRSYRRPVVRGRRRRRQWGAAGWARLRACAPGPALRPTAGNRRSCSGRRMLHAWGHSGHARATGGHMRAPCARGGLRIGRGAPSAGAPTPNRRTCRPPRQTTLCPAGSRHTTAHRAARLPWPGPHRPLQTRARRPTAARRARRPCCAAPPVASTAGLQGPCRHWQLMIIAPISCRALQSPTTAGRGADHGRVMLTAGTAPWRAYARVHDHSMGGDADSNACSCSTV